MSFIQVIEQLGANAALQHLTPAELNSLFTDEDIGNLNSLLNTPIYQCVVQVPAEQEDEPAEEDGQESKIQFIYS